MHTIDTELIRSLSFGSGNGYLKSVYEKDYNWQSFLKLIGMHPAQVGFGFKIKYKDDDPYPDTIHFIKYNTDGPIDGVKSNFILYPINSYSFFLYLIIPKGMHKSLLVKTESSKNKKNNYLDFDIAFYDYNNFNKLFKLSANNKNHLSISYDPFFSKKVHEHEIYLSYNGLKLAAFSPSPF